MVEQNGLWKGDEQQGQKRQHVREREAWRKGDAGRLGKSRCLWKKVCPEEFC